MKEKVVLPQTELWQMEKRLAICIVKILILQEIAVGDLSHSGIYTLNVVANNDDDIILFLNSPIGTAYYRGENGDFVKDTFNVIARQEIDGILYEYNISTIEDYKNQSPENSAVIQENIKVVMKKYDLSREEADAILMDLLGVYEE